MSDGKRPPLGGVVDWDQLVDNQNRGGGSGGEKKWIKVPYIKISPGQSVRFRIVTPAPCEFYRYFKPIMAISPGKDYDVVWREGKYKPKKTYTAYVINRASGVLEAWDFGFNHLQTILTWVESSRVKPSDPEKGCDWVLTSRQVRGEGGKMVTRYTLLPHETTPLKKEEIEMVEAFIKENPLEVLRKANTEEEIQEMYQAYLANPEGPVPGSGKWYKDRSEARKAAGGGSGSSSASSSGSKSAPAASNVKFDDKADISDDNSEDSYSAMVADEDEAGSSGSLF
jgi:hypothetical protein